MSLRDAHEPTALELRYFGLLLAAFLGLIGALATWKWRAPAVGWLVWVAAVVVGVAYYALPPLRRPLFLAWRTAFLPMERAVSFLTLAIVYYLLFTPIGLIMRRVRRDPLERRFEPATPSYFASRPAVKDRARYFRQF